MSENVSVEPSKQRNGVSVSTFMFVVMIVGIVAFVLGTRSSAMLGSLGSIFGVKVATGSVDLSATQDVYRTLKANYYGDIDEQKLQDGASKGLVEAAGDQHTIYMTAKEAKEFDDQLSGSVSGIGAEIGTRDDQPTILRTLESSPAKQVGLKALDIIVSVNGESMNRKTPAQAAVKIRGEAGTTVKMRILRDKEFKEFTITRASVSDSSVASEVRDGVGILTIRRFDKDTGVLARNAVQQLLAQNIKGIVVDLRNNTGGYLDQAQEIAGLWVQSGKPVVLERQKGSNTVKKLEVIGGDPILKDMKTIVLVNGASASASEIVAGALKDYNKATLVGEKTFGKGTVQKVFNLPNGAQLKVTIAKWYTPNDVNITEKGIEPHKKVELSRDDANAGRDPQLKAALEEL